MNAANDKPASALPHDDAIASRARAIFRNACANTDSYHALRLGLARRKALHARTRHPGVHVWAPLAGGAIACCALVVGVVMMRPGARTAPVVGIVASAPASQGSIENTDDIPVIASNQMDMVQDLDFYRWLATQPADASSSPRNTR